jgi:hypothetical protein
MEISANMLMLCIGESESDLVVLGTKTKYAIISAAVLGGTLVATLLVWPWISVPEDMK